MRIFLDTSAWIKYFIEEPGTIEIQKFLFKKSSSRKNSFAASAVTYAEFYATIKRALRGNRIRQMQYDRVKNEFEEQWVNIDVPIVNNELIEYSGRLAEKYALKGCDAFQLSSAIAIKADIFINCDRELELAAKNCNIKVWNPSEGTPYI